MANSHDDTVATEAATNDEHLPPLPILPSALSQVPGLAIPPQGGEFTWLSDTCRLKEWLVARGVAPRHANRFIETWHCETTADVALLLRFELAPLHLANDDNVHADMRRLFGCGAKVAKRIIAELDVFSAPLHVVPHGLTDAINLDTQAEVRRETARTNTLTATRGRPSGATGGAAGASQRRSTGLDAMHRSGTRPATAGPTELHADLELNHAGAIFGPCCHACQMSRVRCPGHDQCRQANTTPANDHVRCGMCIKKRGAKPAVNDRAMRAEAPAPEAAASNADGSDTHLADNSEMFVTAKRRAYSRTLPKPADNPEESTDVDMASVTLPSVLATGNMPIDQRSMRSADSFALAAHPTGSHALAPGPYHRANARLRQLLPHYHSNTTVSTSWAHVMLTALAVLCTLGYFGIRLWYLISGRTAAFAAGAPNTSVWYSWVILVAEVGLVFLAFFGHQLYFKQHTTFRVMDERATSALIQEVSAKGVTQTVHVCVTTYGEAAEMVRECLLRLLAAPEPLDMEKILYVCDDGHAKAEGPKKRAVVDQLRALGHHNVHYVGDRQRQPHQLNGKSANLNHVITQKIYKGVTAAEQVPEKDILMVMDCDHMCKPELFNKMGPCMRDRAVGVTLVPQWFHNLIMPDCLDISNADFFFGKLPFAFGAGQCCITGTNVMIRVRAAFSVSKYASEGFVGDCGYAQVYSEDEISEDTELGSRVHAAGYKSVLVSERLCTGEVPLEPRFFWRQRLRWLKGGHLYVTGEGSLFFEKQPHMSFWQKSLYWLCPVSHFVQVWAEPIMFTLPFLCVVLDVCPYGMDRTIFASHVIFFGVMSINSFYYNDLWLMGNALRSKTGSRVLWFTAFKAVINTLMVHTGIKAKGHFKFTPKAGLAGGDAVDDTGTLRSTGGKSGDGGKAKTRARSYMLQRAHQRASRVTEARKACMPFDGTLDFWVLLSFLLLSLFSAAWGLKRLAQRDALTSWNNDQDSLLGLGVVFALVDSVPGLLFLGYLAVYDRWPGFLKVWSAAVWYAVVVLVILVELRIAVGFASGR